MTKQNKITAAYRQGDTFIKRIDALPANLKPTPPEAGRVILAHGEVTGHAHTFDPTDACRFTARDGAQYFEVTGQRIAVTLPIVRRWKNQVMVNHPKHGLIEFAIADVEIDGDQATIEGKFGLLQHDEHTAQGIPAGLYVGGGDDRTVHQREYTPTEIIRVAD